MKEELREKDQIYKVKILLSLILEKRFDLSVQD